MNKTRVKKIKSEMENILNRTPYKSELRRAKKNWNAGTDLIQTERIPKVYREAFKKKQEEKAVKAIAAIQREEKPIIKRPTIWQRIKQWITNLLKN